VTTVVEHARSLIAATVWADDKILAAADGMSEEQYGELRAQFAHMLGTQRYWHANWTRGSYEEPELTTLAQAREGYAASQTALSAYAKQLTQTEWDRTEQWWLRFGRQERMALGESITQVFYHGIQHRSEIAVRLSSWDRSPGDLDYLTYLAQRGRAV
jgi:uncharacterized damage-inducible protein DinB